jgi:flagellar M-ring protein FliF
MPGWAGTLLSRALGVFASFSIGQKAATICTVLGLVVGGYAFSTWAARPSFAPLYSNLAATDASAIVDKLKAAGTPYQLSDGGQTIMVPQDKVYELRLTMSGQGLPAGKDTGYSLLDKQGVTTSEFMQHVDYQRALEGELANTVGSLAGVTSATVHLAIPTPSVFTDTQQKPTASVLVATEPGQQLSAGQVQAVVHLVSASVVGLDPAQVTVADANGTILSTGSADGTDVMAGSTRAQQTAAYEQRLNGSLQQMLDQLVGPNHAVVTVTADLDYDQTDTKSQVYVSDPKLPPLSQTKKNETYTGTGVPSGGVLGPDNVQVPAGAGGNGKYANTSQTQDNAVGMVTETRRTAPGAVRKLAVAVLLDKNTAKGIDTAAVQRLVSSAVGLDAKRGDTMAVTALPFDRTASTQAKDALTAAAKAKKQSKLLSMAKTGGMVLVVAVLLLVTALRARRGRKRSATLTAAEQDQLEEMQLALDRARTLAIEGAGDGHPALPVSAPRPVAGHEVRQRELTDLVDRQPEDVAQLLRGWLADRRS